MPELYKITCSSVPPSQGKVHLGLVVSDRRGFALVSALMLTLISLTIILSLMYMITRGVEVSGFNKRYKSVLQASYGATDIVTKEILKKVFEGQNTPALLSAYYASSNLTSLTASDCFAAKLSSLTASWLPACDAGSSPNINPDISFLLQSTTATPFQVYAKVVDTVSLGNTDTAGIPTLREAQNVTDNTQGGGIAVPSTYRIEIMTERANNPQERAQLSVLYAY